MWLECAILCYCVTETNDDGQLLLLNEVEMETVVVLLDE